MKVVAVSGYFDPLHVGHIELFERAKALGDKLIVIVNNDEQAKLKKGKSFMPCDERMQIIKSLRMVDDVFKSIDTDRTVCKSLEAVHPSIFANGGDRQNQEIPEASICRMKNIQIVDGLGDKVQSSSTLLKQAQELQ